MKWLIGFVVEFLSQKKKLTKKINKNWSKKRKPAETSNCLCGWREGENVFQNNCKKKKKKKKKIWSENLVKRLRRKRERGSGEWELESCKKIIFFSVDSLFLSFCFPFFLFFFFSFSGVPHRSLADTDTVCMHTHKEGGKEKKEKKKNRKNEEREREKSAYKQ